MYVTTADHLARPLPDRLLDLLQQGRRFPVSDDEAASQGLHEFLTSIGLRRFRDGTEAWWELGEGMDSVRQRCAFPSDTEGEHDHDVCTSGLVDQLDEVLVEVGLVDELDAATRKVFDRLGGSFPLHTSTRAQVLLTLRAAHELGLLATRRA